MSALRAQTGHVSESGVEMEEIMNETLKAAKLDFCLVKPYLRGFRISFLMAVILVAVNKSLTFGVFLTVIISTMLIAYPFSISEKNGMEKMYGILPVSKKHLVMGRYIYTCSIGLLVSLLSTVIYSILLRALGVTVSLPEICVAAVLGFVIFSFYTVVQMPGFYKYGTLKGKGFVYIPLIVYGVFMYVLIQFDIVDRWGFSFVIEKPIVIVGAVLFVFIIVYWISIIASIRALQNKDA